MATYTMLKLGPFHRSHKVVSNPFYQSQKKLKTKCEEFCIFTPHKSPEPLQHVNMHTKMLFFKFKPHLSKYSPQ